MKEWMAKKSKEEGYSRSRLPSFTKEEIEMVKGEFPFRASSDVANRVDFLVKIETPDGLTILIGEGETRRVFCKKVVIVGEYLNITNSHLAQTLKRVHSNTKLILRELCIFLVS